MISFEPLRKLIEDSGLTDNAMRYEVGISPSTLKCIKEDRSIGTEMIERVCIFFDCDISDVMVLIRDIE